MTYGAPNRLEWRRGQKAWMVLGCLTLLFFCWPIVSAPYELGMFFGTVLVTGMFISLSVFGKMVESFSPYPRRTGLSHLDIKMNRLPIGKQGLVVTGAVIAVTTFLNFGIWLDASAILIGFREQNVSVRLAKEDFDELLEQATRNGMAINPCEQITPGASVLRHVDIMWQNLGTRSLLRFPSQVLGSTPRSDNVIRFKTGSNSIANVVSAGRQVRCEEFLTDVLFQEDRKHLRSYAVARLVEQLRWLRNIPPGARIRVVAYGSQSGTMSGDKEALRQALAVKSFLESEWKLPASAVEATSAGALVAKQECDKLSSAQRLLCEKTNRRVEVYLLEPA
jgi:outer membrane protein OmpA-like peptidoglycan-associated protein